MKKTLLVIGILVLIGGAFFGGMAIMNQQKEIEDRYKSPEKLREELKDKENRYPTRYLKLETNLKHNFKKRILRKDKKDGQIISGSITNSATAATYKDVVIKLTFMSKTKTQIGKKEFVIYEAYSPNSSKEFKYKIEIPDATDSYNASIVNAKPVY